MRVIAARWMAMGIAVVGAGFSPLVATAGAPRPDETVAALPSASWSHLPRWRGFNLLEKFNAGKNEAFKEDDFRMISRLGFNFVRLPMDYRCWIVNGDWRTFDDKTLKEVEQAVDLGRRYGVHVSLNFHRGPGYTVAQPPEKKSLWTDPEAQEVFAMHWREFARRFKGIPSDQVSFNLVNEPADVKPEVYARAVKPAIEAIRAEDPDRLIISDGLQWGRNPCMDLVPMQVAQATRGYEPFPLTHYKASWAHTGPMPVPTWPMLDAGGWLAGPGKKDMMAPLRLAGPFPGIARVRVRVAEVSSHSRMVVRAGNATLLDHVFHCGSGTGEWSKAVFRPQWKDYQNVYDRDYEAAIPAGAADIVVENTEGDWMTLSEIGLRRADGTEDVLGLQASYGRKPAPMRYVAGGSPRFEAPVGMDRETLWRERIEPFRALEAKGVGVFVGEWGAYNKTPHPVVLAWMRDCLENWKRANWGWALWNFRGSFGVLDSERADVRYEDFEGHKLDRKMLDILQAY